MLSKGRDYEMMAVRHLKKQGLKLVKTNYYCRLGEIDLVMEDAGIIIFVEVRFRMDATFGSAIESITCNKQRKIIKAAHHFLQQHKLHNRICRFDTITIEQDIKNAKRESQIQWTQNAFQEHM